MRWKLLLANGIPAGFRGKHGWPGEFTGRTERKSTREVQRDLRGSRNDLGGRSGMPAGTALGAVRGYPPGHRTVAGRTSSSGLRQPAGDCRSGECAGSPGIGPGDARKPRRAMRSRGGTYGCTGVVHESYGRTRHKRGPVCGHSSAVGSIVTVPCGRCQLPPRRWRFGRRAVRTALPRPPRTGAGRVGAGADRCGPVHGAHTGTGNGCAKARGAKCHGFPAHPPEPGVPAATPATEPNPEHSGPEITGCHACT